MTQAVIDEIKSRIAELEPKQNELWLELQAHEKAVEEFSKPCKAISSKWCAVYREIESLKKLLPPEVATEEPKQTVPF